jgi:hypothetical protein
MADLSTVIRQQRRFETSQGKFFFFDKPRLNWNSHRSAFASKPVIWLLCGVSALVVSLWALLGFFFLSESSIPSKKANARREESSSRTIPASSEANLSSNDGSPKHETNFTFQMAHEKEHHIFPDREWGVVINSILTDAAETSILSKRLAEVLKEFPLEGQLEAAQHMVNLLGDEDYFTAETVFFDNSISHQVRGVIFEDLMSRPNYVKLPLLVKTLRDFSHPLRREALENLQVYTGQDKDLDPQGWDLVVSEFLDKELQAGE